MTQKPPWLRERRGFLGCFWGIFGVLEVFLGYFFVILGYFWGYFWGFLGGIWGFFGVFWEVFLGVFFGNVRVFLLYFWGYFWGYFGGHFFGISGGFWGYFWEQPELSQCRAGDSPGSGNPAGFVASPALSPPCSSLGTPGQGCNSMLNFPSAQWRFLPANW